MRQSEAIFSATVARTWVDTDRRVHAPVMRVALEDVRAVQGPRADRLLLTFWQHEGDAASPRGGTPPRLRKGGRYVFMTPEPFVEERARYTPITALNGGLFPVLYDPSRRKFLVHDYAGRPVVRIARERLVVVDAAPSGSRGTAPRVYPSDMGFSTGPRIEVLRVTEDPASRVSEEAFLRFVREILTTSIRSTTREDSTP